MKSSAPKSVIIDEKTVLGFDICRVVVVICLLSISCSFEVLLTELQNMVSSWFLH